MATRTILLPIGSAIVPDGSTDNSIPRVQRVKSTASAPTPYFMQASFNDSSVQQLMWAFRMPDDYSSSPALLIQYKMDSATSGDVVFEGRIAAVTPGDSQDVDTNAFGSANQVTDTVPSTAGHLDEVSLPLTNNDSLAGGDFVIVYFARAGNNGSDTASNDVFLVGLSLEYEAG